MAADGSGVSGTSGASDSGAAGNGDSGGAQGKAEAGGARQGADEPGYDSTTDKLILRDAFDEYADTTALLNAYPIGRHDEYVSLIAGRGKPGKAIRLSYGPSTTNDILLGPEGQLKTVGGWNGTLPQVAGPYDHVYFSAWFRTNPGADFSLGTSGSGGIKGFMFWHTAGGTDGGRYEWAISRISCGGSRYSEARGPALWATNDCTGRDIYKTLDGGAPLWSLYNDGNWHRFTVEIYTIQSGHAGDRVWLDGVLTEDAVDNVDPNNMSDFQEAISHFDVFGNGWLGSPANDITIDFDDWIMWTK